MSGENPAPQSENPGPSAANAPSPASDTPAENLSAATVATAPPPSSIPAGMSAESLELPDLATLSPVKKPQSIDLLTDVELNVKIELGRAIMPIEDVLRLGEGSVVELDKLAGDPVDVLVNDRLVARGEVIVLNDNFCVRISEIVANDGEVAAA